MPTATPTPATQIAKWLDEAARSLRDAACYIENASDYRSPEDGEEPIELATALALVGRVPVLQSDLVYLREILEELERFLVSRASDARTLAA